MTDGKFEFTKGHGQLNGCQWQLIVPLICRVRLALHCVELKTNLNANEINNGPSESAIEIKGALARTGQSSDAFFKSR